MKELLKVFKNLTGCKIGDLAKTSGISRQWIDEMTKGKETRKSTKVALYHALEKHIHKSIVKKQQVINDLNDLLTQFEIELIEDKGE